MVPGTIRLTIPNSISIESAVFPHYTFVTNGTDRQTDRPNDQYGPGLYYSVDLQIQMYTEPVPLKYGKLATK